MATQSSSQYSVTISGSIDVPDRDVTIEGSTYTVESVARVNQGDQLTVQTTGPDGEGYRVYIHAVTDGSRSIQDTKFVAADSDGRATFDTSQFDPGSYIVSIYHDGTYYSPHPLVVPAYSVDLATPGTINADESTTLSADLTQTAATKQISSVEFVVANEATTLRLDASESNGVYDASLDSGAVESGAYQVHVVVYGQEDAPGDTNEVIGISDAKTLTVDSPDETTTSHNSDSTSETSTTTTQTTPTTTTSQTTTNTPTQQTTRTTTIHQSTTSSTSTTPSTSSPSPQTTSTTNSTVLTPGTPTSTPTPSGNVPFLSFTSKLLLLVVLSALVILQARHS